MPTNDIPESLEERQPMAPMQGENSKGRFILFGLIFGVLFGTGVLVTGWPNTLLVVISGAVGAVLAWVAHGLANGQLDFNAAWRAFRGT